MMLIPLKLYRPKTIEDILNFIKEGTDNITVIAGGTDIVPKLRAGTFHTDTIVDISLLKNELSCIRQVDYGLRLGALVTHDQISRSGLVQKLVPVLAQACQVVGSQQVRNVGTLGGNIANASPAADTVPVLLALDARVKLVSSRGERTVFLDDIMVGPGRTEIMLDEILTEIIIPDNSLMSTGIFRKLGIRNALNIAIASVAIIIDRVGNGRVAYGSLGPRAIRAVDVENNLNADPIKSWEGLPQIIRDTVQPISDVRATAKYRSDMAVNLTYMSLHELNLI